MEESSLAEGKDLAKELPHISEHIHLSRSPPILTLIVPLIPVKIYDYRHESIFLDIASCYFLCFFTALFWSRIGLPFPLIVWYEASTFGNQVRWRFLRAGEQEVVKQLINRPVAKLSVFLSGFGSPENRRHRRARIKWPVVMTTPNGLVDGHTQNVSLGGAFIRCQQKPDVEENFRLVMSTKDRLVLVNAEIVWSNGHKSQGKSAHHEMGIRFTRISGNDRTFLSGVIANHT